MHLPGNHDRSHKLRRKPIEHARVLSVLSAMFSRLHLRVYPNSSGADADADNSSAYSLRHSYTRHSHSSSRHPGVHSDSRRSHDALQSNAHHTRLGCAGESLSNHVHVHRSNHEQSSSSDLLSSAPSFCDGAKLDCSVHPLSLESGRTSTGVSVSDRADLPQSHSQTHYQTQETSNKHLYKACLSTVINTSTLSAEDIEEGGEEVC